MRSVGDLMQAERLKVTVGIIRIRREAPLEKCRYFLIFSTGCKIGEAGGEVQAPDLAQCSVVLETALTILAYAS